MRLVLGAYLRLVRPLYTQNRTFCGCHIIRQAESERFRNNPFYSRYVEKLQSLRKNSPLEYQARLSDIEKKKADQEIKADENQTLDITDREAIQQKHKTLDSIMKIDLLSGKTSEEISQIWKEYHSKKDCVFAILSRTVYLEFCDKLKQFPTFIYPIPRGTGYEFFMQQFVERSIYFTSLISYQVHKENSPTCLTLTHYTELMEDKGIVLMEAERDEKILSVNEAQLLTSQVQMYYGRQSALRFNLVRIFNNSPEKFEYMDLVKEFENYKKDYHDKRIGDIY